MIELWQATQLDLRPRTPRTIDVDGRIDRKGVIFIGNAVQQFHGTWVCRVEVTITSQAEAAVGLLGTP